MKWKELDLCEVKKIELDILKYVVDFCNKKSIRYYLAYGTLIGTVRHKGFIPWDDDIDIYIPRPDYVRFQKEFIESDIYKCKSCETDCQYVYSYAKVFNERTRIKLDNGIISHDKISIDVFPLDGLPDDEAKARKLHKDVNKLFYTWLLGMSSGQDRVDNSIKGLFFRISYKFGLTNKVARKLSKLEAKFNFEECGHIGNLVNYDGFFEYYKKEWFEPIMMEFEGINFVVPKGYDEILKIYYGDYMKLPPKEKQVSSHEGKYYIMVD